jgi:hypothetical protein
MLVEPAPADHLTGSIDAKACESCAFSSGRISFSDLKGEGCSHRLKLLGQLLGVSVDRPITKIGHVLRLHH